jgi:hypothetical protein
MQFLQGDKRHMRGAVLHDWDVTGRKYRTRKKIAQVRAYTAEDALVIARKYYPEGLYPLSVRRIDGIGPEVWEL